MSDARAGQPPGYEIRLKGHLDSRWAHGFDGMTLTRHGNGTTVLTGPVVDQAALHGLLARLRDLGLPLISVAQLDADDQAPSTSPTDRPPADTGTTPQGD